MKARAVLGSRASRFHRRIFHLLGAAFLIVWSVPSYSQIVIHRGARSYFAPAYGGAISSAYLSLPVRYGYSRRVCDDYGYEGAAVYDEGTYLYDYVNRAYPFTPRKVWRKMFASIDDRMDAEVRAFGVPGQAYRERLYHAYVARKTHLDLDFEK